jgi:beta-glucanase (GH16 family)
MNTAGMRLYTYGKIEGRLALPTGQGTWPALWTLGSNFGSVGWPACGEIDIMEHVNTATEILGTIHWDNGGYVSYTAARPAITSYTSYHTYAIEWNSSVIRWLLDGANVGEANIAGSINGTDEFHRSFFIILNLAIGGNWPGPPNGSTVFPANFGVDYVRVFQAGAGTPTPTPSPTNPPTSTPTPAPGALLSQGKPSLASSSESASYPASNAFDGNTTTRWSSAFSDPQWVRVDLGAVATITRVRLDWEAAYSTVYQVQVSNDGNSWTTVVNVTNGNGGVDDYNVSTSGRYVRMNGTARATAYGHSLWELQVFGTAGSSTPTPTTPPTSTPTPTTPPPSATPTTGGTATPTSATATPTNPPTATPTTGGGTGAWAPNVFYSVGALASHSGTTYRCLQAHTSQVGWEPPNTPALWAVS